MVCEDAGKERERVECTKAERACCSEKKKKTDKTSHFWKGKSKVISFVLKLHKCN